jgi:membrane associated rhomboid family serine protease
VLVAANLAVAFWAPFSPLTAEFAFDPFEPSAFSALTCLFLHDPENILHLLGNLVFLAAVGPLVEREAGPLKFVLVVLVGGLFGVAAHWAGAVYSGVGTPLIGASSAIAASVGYCCVRFARRRVPLAPRLNVNVWGLALFWVALQAVGAFVKFGAPGGTSYLAHVGGFVGGVALAFVLRAQKRATVEADREALASLSERSPAAALEAANEFLRRHPGDHEAMWNKAAALHAMGDTEREAQVLTEFVRSWQDVERAVDCLLALGRARDLSALERMKLAGMVSGENRLGLLKSVAEEPESEPQRPYAILALAEEGRTDLLEVLRRSYAYHPATEAARAKGLLE